MAVGDISFPNMPSLLACEDLMTVSDFLQTLQFGIQGTPHRGYRLRRVAVGGDILFGLGECEHELKLCCVLTGEDACFSRKKVLERRWDGVGVFLGFIDGKEVGIRKGMSSCWSIRWSLE